MESALRALETGRETADRRIETDALNTLAAICHRAGRGPEAIAHYQHALLLARNGGQRYPEAVALGGLAELHDWLGEPESAVIWAQRALAIIVPCGYRMLEPRVAGIAALPRFVLSDRD
jgi:tetratricopeptide (TPR) repeat protein